MHIINKGGVCAPLGFTASSANADVKGNGAEKDDLCLLYSEVPFKLAATFTSNKFKAAPLKHAMAQLEKSKEYQAIIVNSGNANASTGEQGIKDCETIASSVASTLDINPDFVLTASTGTIGVHLPVDKMVAQVDKLVDDLDDGNSTDFAKAIMTTDTFEKEVGVLVETDGGAYVVAGCSKGAGMIAPHMATMLCYITTDAMVSEGNLQKTLDNAIKPSFNSITVDNDMSTNDTVFLMANGMSGIIPDMKQFQEAVDFVAMQLAKLIVKDGEGATKFITINIKNAASDEDASKCAFAIANSPLVKTMFYGEDPNWGRLIATVGASGVEAYEEKTDIYFGDLPYAKGGMIIDNSLEPKAAKLMQQKEISVTIDLNVGDFEKTVYTCDLSKEYVSINADYRT